MYNARSHISVVSSSTSFKDLTLYLIIIKSSSPSLFFYFQWVPVRRCPSSHLGSINPRSATNRQGPMVQFAHKSVLTAMGLRIRIKTVIHVGVKEMAHGRGMKRLAKVDLFKISIRSSNKLKYFFRFFRSAVTCYTAKIGSYSSKVWSVPHKFGGHLSRSPRGTGDCRPEKSSPSPTKLSGLDPILSAM